MTCLIEIADGVGIITLDRPKAINALTLEMMEQLSDTLHRWATDDAVTRVVIRGNGERGFCSGADVRRVRELILADEPYMKFFDVEYQLNSLIAHYPKPYRAEMYGITMGGGLGLSAHGNQRVANETSVFAMPETIIGFHPDVGMLWHLSRSPGECGTHVALTGATFGAADAKYLGIVDEIEGDVSPGELENSRDWIDECYAGDDILEIIKRLEHHENPEARKAVAAIRQRSPLSVAATLVAIRRAKSMAIDEVLAMDRQLATTILRHPNFAEGVRAQLVDKDRQPKWQPARLEDLDPEEVAGLFHSRD